VMQLICSAHLLQMRVSKPLAGLLCPHSIAI
jgi:hypothetical protein